MYLLIRHTVLHTCAKKEKADIQRISAFSRSSLVNNMVLGMDSPAVSGLLLYLNVVRWWQCRVGSRLCTTESRSECINISAQILTVSPGILVGTV